MADTPLWTPEAVLAATGGRLEGTPPAALTGVSIDSRAVQAGDIFVAIRGDSLDGHDYAAAALRAGAGLAVVARADDDMRAAGALVVVPDTLKALEDLGRAARARTAARIVAVTGSVGKTTTKDALRLALSACGPTHASVASFNNHWGVPLTLARMPREAAYGVFEIGMNHAGEITPLVAMVRPHVAIVTAVAESHLGHFASLDEIADAKAEIFSGLEPGGVAVINRDSAHFDRLAAAARAAGAARIVGFGEAAQAEARLTRVKLHEACSCVTASIGGVDVTYKLGAPGRHVVHNSLAVLAAVQAAGANLARAALALAALTPPKGRGVRHRLQVDGGAATLIDESYNANPASMRAALAMAGSVAPAGRGRRIAVLGDMLELGPAGPGLHAGLIAPLTESGIDLVFACGPLMGHLWESLPKAARGAYAPDSSGLVGPLAAALQPGDVVVVKGSLGSRMAPVVAAMIDKFGATRGES